MLQGANIIILFGDTGKLPGIITNKGLLSFQQTGVGHTSPFMTFIVSGNNLTDDITLEVDAGFVINLDGSTNNDSPIVLPRVGSSVAPTTIFVRFQPTLEQSYDEHVHITSMGAVEKQVRLLGIGSTPSVYASVFDISGLDYQGSQGPSAASDPFSITGEHLTPAAGNVTVTPSTNIEVFNGSTWTASSFTIPYVGSSLSTGADYMVRLKNGLSPDNYPFETLTISGGGSPDFVLAVVGMVSAPDLDVTETSLSFPNTVKDGYSVSQTFDVSGEALYDDVVITAPAGFIVNLDDSDNNNSPIFISPVSGSVAPTTVYVKFHPSAVQSFSDTLTVASLYATTKNIVVSGTAPAPTVSVSANSLSNLVAPDINETSSSESYDVSGTFCYDDIVITAPAEFIINLDDSDNDDGPIVLTPDSDGIVISTPIYVKFKPSTYANASGNITNASDGATTKNVAITGSFVYDFDSYAYFNELSPAPDTSYKADVNDLVLDLKSIGQWTKLVRLWLHGAPVQQYARVSLVNPTSTKITEVNSPTFTANRGYTGNGSSQYLQLGFIPSSDGAGIYTLNDNSAFVYSRTNSTSTSVEIGCRTATELAYMHTRFSDGRTYAFVNSSGGTAVNQPSAASTGLIGWKRVAGASSPELWRNGVSLGSNSNPSLALPNVEMYGLAKNNAGSAENFSSRQISIEGVGADVDYATLYPVIQAFAVSRGFNV